MPWSMLTLGESEVALESLRPLCLCTITILVAVLPIGSPAALFVVAGLDVLSLMSGDNGASCLDYFTIDSLSCTRLCPDCTDVNVEDFF